MSDFILSRRDNKSKSKTSKLNEIFSNWQGEKENWLFISPHDDDVAIGSGILLQKAVSEQINTTVLIATDGQMGYCSETQIANIVEIRRTETINSFKELNIENLEWLNFPDGNLNSYMGRRRALEDDYGNIYDHTGLQNSFTYYFRKLKPTRIFIPTGEDLHTDHKIVFQETLISLFHATSQIWPELGPSLEKFPEVYEMAVYCDFNGLPDIKIECSEQIFQNKMNAIKSYESQKNIIDKLVGKIQSGGPVEYFRDIRFNLYSAAVYQDVF